MQPLLSRDGAVLLIVDMQEKLANSMSQDVWSAVSRHTRTLIAAARTLGLPIIVTEQYAKGLGPTVSELRDAIGTPAVEPIDKVEFSCARVPGFGDRLRASDARQVIMVGMEAHICIMQSAVDLKAAGWPIWVAEDATCSRTKANWRAGLRLCERGGVEVAPVEALLFMLLERAGTPAFKTLSQLIRG